MFRRAAGVTFSMRDGSTIRSQLIASTRRHVRVQLTFTLPTATATLRSDPIPLRRPSLLRRCGRSAVPQRQWSAFNLCSVREFHSTPCRLDRRPDALEQAKHIQHRPPDEEKSKEEAAEEEEESKTNDGYLPFAPPFHTINIMSVLFMANLIIYILMNWVCDDDWREFIVDHFTVSRENWHLIYPLFTNSFYQEHLLQLAIDLWLLWQFGNTVLDFLGSTRMLTFWAMCTLGGSLIHVGRQYFELYIGIDPLDVRGRCFGPNPFILGLVAVEGLILRHLNFMQSPPVPFLVLTAFVMIIDVWRVFTTKPEEHGASTGGALVAYLFWVMPTKLYGLNRLTAAV